MLAVVSRKMIYPVHTLLPPISPTWLSVAEALDEEHFACTGKPREQYFFPVPQLFTNVGLPSKTQTYLGNWLRLQTIVIGVAQSSTPYVMSHQAWRCWLEFCELELEDVEGTSVAARRHQQWKQEIDGMIKAAAAEIAIELPAVGT